MSCHKWSHLCQDADFPSRQPGMSRVTGALGRSPVPYSGDCVLDGLVWAPCKEDREAPSKALLLRWKHAMMQEPWDPFGFCFEFMASAVPPGRLCDLALSGPRLSYLQQGEISKSSPSSGHSVCWPSTASVSMLSTMWDSQGQRSPTGSDYSDWLSLWTGSTRETEREE